MRDEAEAAVIEAEAALIACAKARVGASGHGGMEEPDRSDDERLARLP